MSHPVNDRSKWYSTIWIKILREVDRNGQVRRNKQSKPESLHGLQRKVTQSHLCVTNGHTHLIRPHMELNSVYLLLVVYLFLQYIYILDYIWHEQQFTIYPAL